VSLSQTCCRGRRHVVESRRLTAGNAWGVVNQSRITSTHTTSAHAPKAAATHRLARSFRNTRARASAARQQPVITNATPHKGISQHRESRCRVPAPRTGSTSWRRRGKTIVAEGYRCHHDGCRRARAIGDGVGRAKPLRQAAAARSTSQPHSAQPTRSAAIATELRPGCRLASVRSRIGAQPSGQSPRRQGNDTTSTTVKAHVPAPTTATTSKAQPATGRPGRPPRQSCCSVSVAQSLSKVARTSSARRRSTSNSCTSGSDTSTQIARK
jgi:hypothetical protein